MNAGGKGARPFRLLYVQVLLGNGARHDRRPFWPQPAHRSNR